LLLWFASAPSGRGLGESILWLAVATAYLGASMWASDDLGWVHGWLHLLFASSLFALTAVAVIYRL
jgi:hypothetical protein